MLFVKWGIRIYYSKPISFLLHNCLYWLKKELRDCSTVLDLGCGSCSPLLYQKVKFSIGVDYFLQYLLKSRDKRIHNFYIQADIRNIEFKPESFDAVLLLNVIEHLKKDEGLILLKKAFEIARKKIIVTSPNGYLKQIVKDRNPFQVHQSGWYVEELKRLGFEAKGLCGFKFFRTDTHCEDPYTYLERTLSTIRFKPRIFWLLIAEASQVIAWRFPHLCFEVFYTKKKV